MKRRRPNPSRAPQTLVQLPTANVKFPELEDVAARFHKNGCEIFRDPSSRNADAIKLACAQRGCEKS